MFAVWDKTQKYILWIEEIECGFVSTTTLSFNVDDG